MARLAAALACGGVGVGEGAGHPQQRRRPVLIDLQRRDVGLRRLRLIVLLAEQVAPQGLDRGVVGGGPGRVPQQRVGLPVAPEGPRGAGRAVQVDGVRRALQPVDEHPKPGRRLVAPAQVLVEQRQLQPRRADGIRFRHRGEPLLGRLVFAAEDVEPREQRRPRRVRGVPLPRQGPRLVVFAVGQHPRGRAVELVLLRPRVALLGRRRGRPRPRDADDERGAEHAEAGTSARHTASPVHQVLNGPIISRSGRRGATLHPARPAPPGPTNASRRPSKSASRLAEAASRRAPPSARPRSGRSARRRRQRAHRRSGDDAGLESSAAAAAESAAAAPPSSRSAWKSASSMTATPSCSALCRFEPGLAPATR